MASRWYRWGTTGVPKLSLAERLRWLVLVWRYVLQPKLVEICWWCSSVSTGVCHLGFRNGLVWWRIADWRLHRKPCWNQGGLRPLSVSSKTEARSCLIHSKVFRHIHISQVMNWKTRQLRPLNSPTHVDLTLKTSSQSIWKGNDQKPIQSNSTCSPKHHTRKKHKQLRRHKGKHKAKRSTLSQQMATKIILLNEVQE